jgi:hypothetical protein
MAQILQEVVPALWRRIHSLINMTWNMEQTLIDWKMGTVCPLYKKTGR